MKIVFEMNEMVKIIAIGKAFGAKEKSLKIENEDSRFGTARVESNQVVVTIFPEFLIGAFDIIEKKVAPLFKSIKGLLGGFVADSEIKEFGNKWFPKETKTEAKTQTPPTVTLLNNLNAETLNSKKQYQDERIFSNHSDRVDHVEKINNLTKTLTKNGYFIDDHRGEKTSIADNKIKFVILDGGREICPVYTNIICGLNNMYLSNGEAHLSRWSVGATIRYGKIDEYEDSTDSSVEEIDIHTFDAETYFSQC